MRKFREMVQSRFHSRMAEALPQFEPIAVPGDRSPKAYRWRVSDNLAFFVVLSVDPERRAFTADVAWGKADADPTWIPLGDPDTGLPFNAPEEAMGILPCRFPIGLLWKKDAIGWQLRIEDELALTGVELPTNLSRGLGFPGWVRFRPDSRDRWIAEHPELYPQQLEGPERLIFPLVDHLIEQLMNHALPKFKKIINN